MLEMHFSDYVCNAVRSTHRAPRRFVSLVSGSFSISNVSLTTDFKFMKGFNKFKGNLGGIEVTFSSQSVRLEWIRTITQCETFLYRRDSHLHLETVILTVLNVHTGLVYQPHSRFRREADLLSH
ncbi:hypothetical protein F2P81_019512 [Scophthalmus maximus]|uniref:Uncharacterized protein n=1 Tax=Scophthalmus maximus TaxID=52904 RepID=A0A6A4S812_SCOMX|nr:hypothetical protein F2P81_019512 [Scophthalmus maximus]